MGKSSVGILIKNINFKGKSISTDEGYIINKRSDSIRKRKKSKLLCTEHCYKIYKEKLTEEIGKQS